MFFLNNPTRHLYLKGKLLDNDDLVTIYFREDEELGLKGSLDIFDTLVPFGNIKSRFHEILNTWFSMYNNYQSPFLLFFETVYHLKLNLENRFLNMVYSLRLSEKYPKHKQCAIIILLWPDINILINPRDYS
jgi:hypothetical protein